MLLLAYFGTYADFCLRNRTENNFYGFGHLYCVSYERTYFGPLWPRCRAMALPVASTRSPRDFLHADQRRACKRLRRPECPMESALALPMNARAKSSSDSVRVGPPENDAPDALEAEVDFAVHVLPFLAGPRGVFFGLPEKLLVPGPSKRIVRPPSPSSQRSLPGRLNCPDPGFVVNPSPLAVSAGRCRFGRLRPPTVLPQVHDYHRVATSVVRRHVSCSGGRVELTHSLPTTAFSLGDADGRQATCLCR